MNDVSAQLCVDKNAMAIGHTGHMRTRTSYFTIDANGGHCDDATLGTHTQRDVPFILEQTVFTSQFAYTGRTNERDKENGEDRGR